MKIIDGCLIVICFIIIVCFYLFVVCSDVLFDCVDYGKSVCIGDYEKWVKENCKLYCNYCDG